MLDGLFNLNINKASHVFVFAISAVSPGILTVLQFNPDYVENLAVLTLAILASSISGPTLVLNVILMMGFFEWSGPREDLYSPAVVAGSFLNLVAFALPLAFCYIFGIGTFWFVLVLFAIELVVTITIGYVAIFVPRTE